MTSIWILQQCIVWFYLMEDHINDIPLVLSVPLIFSLRIMCLKFIHVIVRGLSLFLLQVNMPQFFMHFPVNEPLN